MVEVCIVIIMSAGAHILILSRCEQISGMGRKCPTWSRDGAEIEKLTTGWKKLCINNSSTERLLTTNAQNTSQHFQRGQVPPLAYAFGSIVRSLDDTQFYRAALMQTRSSDENSVCPSVCQTRALRQNERKISPDFYTGRKIMYSSIYTGWARKLGHFLSLQA